MGKRRRNERMILGNPAGPENFHYCKVHDLLCTPYSIWPQMSVMMWECRQGCRTTQGDTILKTKPATKKR